MRRRLVPLIVGALGAGLLSVGLVVSAGPSSADGGCSEYSALAAAAGVRTVQSAPGLVLTDVDAALPAAQAQADSLSGSQGWAGAPYSTAAAGNVGLTGINPNDVPVFAVSSYPAQPASQKSTPAGTIEAKSGAQSSTASAGGSGPASDQASEGRVVSSADAACREDASVRAVADNVAQMVDIKGVLRIGSVSSHAQAVVDPAGERNLQGTMEVEGATVAGQPVAITDRGVVTGSSATPLPDDPLAQALAAAGISVRYVAAVKDAKAGEVFAPGLEVVVAKAVQGVGTGPASTTYMLGRAYARAVRSGHVASTVGAAVASGTPVASEPPSGQVPRPSAASGAAPGSLSSAQSSTVAAAAPLAPSPHSTHGRPASAGQRVSLANASLPNASNGGVYTAMGAGVLLLVGAWLVFERLGVRLRWR